MFEQFIPITSAAVLAGLFSIARFENQRWCKVISTGRVGMGQSMQAVVLMTGIISHIFGAIFLISFGMELGWQPAIGLMIVSFATSFLWAAFAPLTPVFWVLATLLIWPAMIALSFKTNWFGFI